MAYVYGHLQGDTKNVFYIGIGSDKYHKRSKSKRSRSDFWKSIVAKHGFIVEILFDNISRAEACKKEIDLICQYGRRDLGNGILCNMTAGGDGMADRSKESIEKLRLRMINNSYSKGNVMSSEHRQTISLINKGRRLSEEHKRKISIKNSERIVTEETKAKISSANKGRKLPKRSDDYIEKLRISSTGKVHSKESRAKMSMSKKGIAPTIPNECRIRGGKHFMAKKVIDYSTGVIYDCGIDAANGVSMNYRTLKNMLNGSKNNKTTLEYYNGKLL